MDTTHSSSPTFRNEFDLTNRDISEIEIKEVSDKSNCFIWDTKVEKKSYESFLLTKNTKSKTICKISFHKSKKTKKYVPRLEFKRIAHNGDIRSTKSKDKVTISFSNSEDAAPSGS